MLEKFKSLIIHDTTFYIMVVLLIGVASFLLGRLSSTDILDTTHREAGMTIVHEGTQELQVVSSVHGSVYHLPWCAGAPMIDEKNRVWHASIGAAESAGLRPAGNCPGI